MAFDLEKAIAAWRRPLEVHSAFSAEDVEELEGSLRDRVEVLVGQGVPEKEAYHTAQRRIGAYDVAETEYRKVYWGKVRREHRFKDAMYWRLIMLVNHIKFAFRAIRKQKGYTFINTAGLALGLACCILIFQFVAYQYSFDGFHEKADQLYRVALSVGMNDEGRKTSSLLGHGFGPAFADDIPEITRFARVFSDFFQEGPTVSYRTPTEVRTFKESQVLYVDPELLEMFTYPMLKGDRATALRQPQTLLLTERTATKYFGDEDPIGKTLEYRSIGFIAGEYTVAGVLKDIPANSHLQFDMLLPMEDLLDQYGDNGLVTAPWDPNGGFTAYVEMRPDAHMETIEPKLSAVVYRNLGDDLEAMNAVAAINLQPLASVYLDRETQSGSIKTGHKASIQFFALIALITLVIALINYINLATARAMDRAREVGVRKTMGALRKQLIGQFMIESVLTNLTAFVLALGGVLLLTPVVNALANTHITPSDTWSNPFFLAASVAVFALGVILSGMYPAFVLSSFQPVRALKGKLESFRSRITLRKGLVVLQFAASIALLTGTGVVYSQLQFMRGVDIGLDVEQILVVTSPRVLPDGMDGPTAETTLKNEVLELAAVREASFAGNMVGKGFNVGTLATLEGRAPSSAKEVRVTGADHAFAEVYGLDLVAGEPFHDEMSPWFMGPGDMPRPVLINETVVRTFGLPTNEAALGKIISAGGLRYIVQGVLEDFNWSSVHQPAEAVLFRYLHVNRFLSLKVAQTDMTGTIEAINTIYDELFPNDLFQYQFADAVYAEQYRTDEQFATLFSIFASLSIFIACLGLFGLASFTAARRRREIGIRKALGASASSIVRLISFDFLLLVVVAFFVGTPIAWYFTSNWLEGFAYRIDLSVWLVVAAGVLTVLIALLTVSYQSIKAALANPVQSLRYE